MFALAEPFVQKGLFDFGTQDISTRVRQEMKVMLNERLTGPPEESYSLHRKLSGCFLACTKLKAQVDCHWLFARIKERMEKKE